MPSGFSFWVAFCTAKNGLGVGKQSSTPNTQAEERAKLLQIACGECRIAAGIMQMTISSAALAGRTSWARRSFIAFKLGLSVPGPK